MQQQRNIFYQMILFYFIFKRKSETVIEKKQLVIKNMYDHYNREAKSQIISSWVTQILWNAPISN